MFLFEFDIFGDGIKFSGVGFDDVCLRDSTGRTVDGIETVFGDFGIVNEFTFVEKGETDRFRFAAAHLVSRIWHEGIVIVEYTGKGNISISAFADDEHTEAF